jgi:hypothetical protein
VTHAAAQKGEDTVEEAAEATAKVTDKNVNQIANKFAPRPSGKTGKNPATKGSTLYNIFTYQAWLCMFVGGLLSFNLLFPSDRPDIARLMGCAVCCVHRIRHTLP